MTTVGDVLELVRAPAALTVLGDTMAGGYAGGGRLRRRQWLLPVASVFLYSGGMALNDYADRTLDAVERPERPIPSGRIAPRRALGIAVACMAVGLGLAAGGGGRRALTVAVPLVGAIVSYNTVFKDTVIGPVSMAACRGLDVMMGAGGARAAVPAAAAVALHTAGVTAQSRGEVHGGSTRVAAAGLTVTSATTIASVAGGVHSPIAVAGALAGGAAYAGAVLPSQLAALDDPSAGNVRTATRAGIGAMIPLQATLVARTGAHLPAMALGAVDLLRRRLAARRRAGDVT
ncbi:SCO3242 family prenyltransferase [Agromyces ramosus]|uniref:4-hydroxybenzoate polyprenyltransferase n=1 Tax=Agromyces ramosus TaxID=33879 RepID=A0ABU0R927_9MICO|nr:UbiA family prenyltransferase [Agromyces ramosus]MDQ0894232.1 4-hydroxybenzoate polyprenyltransferase [Agromyces ramosus]